MTIQFLFNAPGLAAGGGPVKLARLYLLSLIDPFGTLWFIYLLPIFFVVIKLTRRIPVPLVWLFGAALEIAHVNTGRTVPDEFAARFVYCYTGYIMAKPIFALTARAQAHSLLAIAGFLVWGLLNGALVQAGYAQLPFISLALGLLGAAAVMTASSLMAKSDLFKPLRYCGRNSIVIYPAFFLPMAATRQLLVATGWIADIGSRSALVTAAGVAGSLLLFWAVRGTWAKFLFERPALLWLVPKSAAGLRMTLQPAE